MNNTNNIGVYPTEDTAKTVKRTSSKSREWRHALLLAFVGLPMVALLSVCAYGFFIWIMQMLVWGPPR